MHEIKLRIHEENELYSPFDETCRTLSTDVVDYISNQYSKKGIDEQIILKIKCDGQIDYEMVRGAFQELIQEQEVHNANQRRRNRIKQLWLLIVGVIFVTAAIISDGKLGSVFVELISIVGSFAVWEAANIWIVENPKIHLQKILLKKLNSTKIIIE